MSDIATCFAPQSCTHVTTVLCAVAQRRPDIVKELMDAMPVHPQERLHVPDDMGPETVAHKIYLRCRGDDDLAKRLEDIALDALIGRSYDASKT